MASTKIGLGRRAPKGDKRERICAALLEAARALVRERGYERTTLEKVAKRAGMTTGAIYGNFKNRDDLFIALAGICSGWSIKCSISPRSKRVSWSSVRNR